MLTLNVPVPEEMASDLQRLSELLKIKRETCTELAINYFLQSRVVDSIIEGTTRSEEGQTLVSLPLLQEMLEIDIFFHPLALEELEALSEETQADVLEGLVSCLTGEEESLENVLELVLKEEGDAQLVLAQFAFGELIYQISEDKVAVYHIVAFEEEDEDEDEENDEEEGEDDEGEEE